MSFNKVKKSAYSSISTAFGSVEKGLNVVDKSLSIAEDYLDEVILVRATNKEERVLEKTKQAQRNLIIDGNDARLEFYKTLSKSESELTKLKEQLSQDSLEEYKHLL